MTVAKLDHIDTERALQIWADYTAAHDLSDRHGQAAGIDPKSGRIWFGKDMLDVVDQMNAAGEFRPLFYVRVGYPSYWRKGGRR